MKINKLVVGIVGALGALTGCVKNQDIEYSDYDYQTVYFATQFAPRTVELGEDEFVDNSLDNQRKVMIKATLGGVRDNKKNVTVGITVDPTLCDRLYFPNNGPKVVAMPSNYYTLASNEITIPTGSILGGVEVQLTDAFFNDPLTIGNNYAIPLVLSNLKGADSILSGRPYIANPVRTNPAHWAVQPKDYVLYALKYVNQWHGAYLRRGVDVGTGSLNGTIVRHKQYVEQDEVNKITTAALSKVNFPVVFKDSTNVNVTCNLQLTFDGSGNCTIVSTTPNSSATGSGKFVKKGEVKAWGNKDRDALYLDYAVNITYTPPPTQAIPSPAPRNMVVSTKDTLVIRDRAVAYEIITPEYK